MPCPISEQVVVITGASSGIGRETALAFGRVGASVVLAARNDAALQQVAAEIDASGGKAHVVVTDVAEWEQVDRLATAAVERCGRIDTWVNNAGVSEYATVEQATIAELDRIVQVNLMGVIYGVKAALPHLEHGGGGAIVNLSSVVGVRAVPLQAVYCATKHAIRGFSDGLRLELEHDGSGITVTTILPSTINTPFYNQARSKTGKMGNPVPPVYEPIVVAEAILYAAEHPQREVFIGAAGRVLAMMQRVSPALTDKCMLAGGIVFKQQQRDQPAGVEDNLFAPVSGTGSTTGGFEKLSQSTSVYTRLLGQHPNRGRAALAAGVLGTLALRRWASD